MTQGLARFSTLSWFLDFEDDEDRERGDALEGRRKYLPIDGVVLSKRDGPNLKLPESRSFQAVARERDTIFIYSTSTELSANLAERFRRPHHVEMACVEITDPNVFAARLGSALKERSPIQRLTLFYDLVSYYSYEDDPSPFWALPHRLVIHKHRPPHGRLT